MGYLYSSWSPLHYTILWVDDVSRGEEHYRIFTNLKKGWHGFQNRKRVTNPYCTLDSNIAVKQVPYTKSDPPKALDNQKHWRYSFSSILLTRVEQNLVLIYIWCIDWSTTKVNHLNSLWSSKQSKFYLISLQSVCYFCKETVFVITWPNIYLSVKKITVYIYIIIQWLVNSKERYYLLLSLYNN